MTVTDRFNTYQAAKLAGLKYDTADYWATSGFLKPSIADSCGHASARAYSFVDVLAMKTAAELRRNGISLQGLRKVVKHLQARGITEPALANVYLVSDGKDVYECRGDELQSILQSPGQTAMRVIVDLSLVEKSLRKDVAELIAA